MKFRLVNIFNGRIFNGKSVVDKDGNLYSIDEDEINPLDINHWVLQGYTGFKDCNGIEIYDDDLVIVNDKLHRIILRDGGFYCSGTEYGLNTRFFVGGAPKVVSNLRFLEFKY